jgi:thiamine-monophosphate kinase
MREFDFIANLAAFSPEPPEGIGDDGAILGDYIIVKDIMVEGTHFQRNWGLDAIVERLFISNISDICAMGGRASEYRAFLGVALPKDIDKAAFAAALEECARKYGVLLLGGDTVASQKDLFLSLTLIGRRGKKLLLRSGAREGDLLCLSRAVGGAAIELEKRLKGEKAENFPPEQALGEFLGELNGVGACIDISDGLGRDLSHMAEASGLRIVLNARDIALAEGAHLPTALSSGEEYALAFTLHPGVAIPKACSVIGHVEAGEGVFLSQNGELYDISTLGYEHD